MPYVINEKCLGEVYAACVDVCPVDCIHPGKLDGKAFMIIDPEICIDCGVCLPECPVGAILDNADESPEWTKKNEELAAEFKNNPIVTPRPINEKPNNPENKNQNL